MYSLVFLCQLIPQVRYEFLSKRMSLTDDPSPLTRPHLLGSIYFLVPPYWGSAMSLWRPDHMEVVIRPVLACNLSPAQQWEQRFQCDLMMLSMLSALRKHFLLPSLILAIHPLSWSSKQLPSASRLCSSTEKLFHILSPLPRTLFFH